jgi:hypothetical protein
MRTGRADELIEWIVQLPLLALRHFAAKLRSVAFGRKSDIEPRPSPWPRVFEAEDDQNVH